MKRVITSLAVLALLASVPAGAAEDTPPSITVTVRSHRLAPAGGTDRIESWVGEVAPGVLRRNAKCEMQTLIANSLDLVAKPQRLIRV